MKCTAVFDIQNADTDWANAISNITYVRWLDLLRIKWFDTILAREHQQTEGLVLVVSRVEVDYLATVGFFDGQIIGEIEDIERGNARVIFHANFWLKEKKLASAVQKTVLMSATSRRPTRFPAELLQRLAEVSTEQS